MGEKKTKNVYPSVHPLSLVTAEKHSLEEGEEKKKCNKLMQQNCEHTCLVRAWPALFVRVRVSVSVWGRLGFSAAGLAAD